jgi:putative membrane protein insertion efficiency factor
MKKMGLLRFLTHLPQRLLIAIVQAYRLLLSPWLGSGCRFSPTCSAYALTALEQHGAAYGSALTVWRIARCHPWCAGGLDPVPEHKRHVSKQLFTSLLIKKSP